MTIADPIDSLDRDELRAAIGSRAIVLVGMMGSGKSAVGRRLATRLGLPFVDADTEIETAAGMTIPEIFAQRGEADFRSGERRVISRILITRAPLVLATGGGAFMNAETRARIADLGISIWLKAEPEVLMRRVRKRSNRPLLQTANPEETLRAMLREREPVYALSELTLVSRDEPIDVVVSAAITALDRHLRTDPDRKPMP
ncbi:MAG: shikimate kinase [Hyphomicrobiales bacterium]|nr:MAG: shikimate kinase [Hyphomicrobiales bacterium]